MAAKADLTKAELSGANLNRRIEHAVRESLNLIS
jgi:uncharacterized protein YjbI with pentapeptide repeats